MIAALLASLVIAPPAALPRSHAGWHVGTARIANASCPRCIQTDSWASTIRYRDAPNDFPQRTMAKLGPRDLIVPGDTFLGAFAASAGNSTARLSASAALRSRRASRATRPTDASHAGASPHGGTAPLSRVYVLFGSPVPTGGFWSPEPSASSTRPSSHPGRSCGHQPFKLVVLLRACERLIV